MGHAKVQADDLVQARLVAIIRVRAGVDLLQVGHALARGDVRAMEITLNTPGALPAIAQLRQELEPSVYVGAGTILCAADARAAIEAGAQFVVTPTMQLDSIALCRQRSVPIICGCASPTEAFIAHGAGADLIKLFPADRLGLPFIRALLAEMPFLRLVPTGGVSLTNLARFIDAGCAAVAVGSQLVDTRSATTGRWDELTTRARAFMDELRRTHRHAGPERSAGPDWSHTHHDAHTHPASEPT